MAAGSIIERPITLFYSYAHEDESLRNGLEKHLSLLRRQGLITGWHDRDIGAGTEWVHEIDSHLDSAQIILLLISADFLASDYCYGIEMKRAMERNQARTARVIPVILRPIDLEATPFGQLRALPSNGNPITKWANRDEAFLDVAQGIRKAVNELRLEGKGTFDLPALQNYVLPVASSMHPTINQSAAIRSFKEDWRDAPDTSIFYGRHEDLANLEQWIVTDNCRVVAILGMGGIGKTTLGSKLVQQIKHHFDCVIWRSLRNAPLVQEVLVELIQFLSDQKYSSLPANVNEQVKILVKHLSEKRCLLILDNIEEILQSGSRTGKYREGYEGYSYLFQRVGDTSHQSCLIVTSREKPKEVAFLEGKISPVRSLQLQGLKLSEGQELLEDKGLFGSPKIWGKFIDLYLGNPLALKLASQTIREVFGGNIVLFLKEDSTLVGDIHHLLEEHFQRLSVLEQEILYWFSVEREPISVEDLRKNTLYTVSKEALLEALKSLRQRSLIEGYDAFFTLQPVIMEFVISRLIDRISKEIDNENMVLLESVPLIKAQTKDYVRESQVRLILKPIADQLTIYSETEIKRRFDKSLAQLRGSHPHRSGYGAGNILNLLVQLQFDLRGYDFSHLTVRQAYLQRVALPEVNFAYANLETTSFTDTFGNIFSVAISPDGQKVVAGTATGELRIWRTLDGKPLFTCQGHVNGVRSVAFSPTGDVMASGGDDQTIRLWRTDTGDHLHVLQEHRSGIRAITFSTDGSVLASGSDDQTVRFWNVASGQCFKVLREHTHRIMALAFSLDGKYLATGSGDQTSRLWELSTDQCLLTLKGHNGWIRSVAFDPKSQLLATAGDDQAVRIWEISTGRCLHILEGHASGIRSITFSPNGNVLASASEDHTVRIWQVETGHCFYNLLGHDSWVRSVAFSPDSQLLVSGGEDQTVRIWEVSTGNCLRTLQGFTSGVRSVAFTSNSKTLISGSSDQTVRIWQLDTGDCRYTLRKHTNEVRTVALSSDEQLLGSGSTDQTIQIWQLKTSRHLYELRGHTNRVRSVAFSAGRNMLASGSDDHTVRLWKIGPGSTQSLHVLQKHARGVRIIAFAPDGNTLASGSSDHTICLWETDTGSLLHVLHGHTDGVRTIAFSLNGELLASGSTDRTIRIWQVSSGHCLHVLEGHTNRIRYVAFSRDGEFFASASNDHTLRLWEVDSGRCLYTLKGHTGAVRSVAFSSDGRTLVSGSDDHTLRLWEVDSGRCLYTLKGHTGAVRLVVFSSIGSGEDTIISGSDDGIIKLWEKQTGKCLRSLEGEKLCEQMNIAKARGLTDAQRNTLIALGAIEDEEPV